MAWLTTPPVEPRPNVTDDGPCSTSTSCSVERIAIVAAEIAHAVDEEIVAGGESADGQVVALRAAFAGRQADAGNVAQRVAQRGDALLLHHLLRNGGDGLRRVEQRLRSTSAKLAASASTLVVTSTEVATSSDPTKQRWPK